MNKRKKIKSVIHRKLYLLKIKIEKKFVENFWFESVIPLPI